VGGEPRPRSVMALTCACARQRRGIRLAGSARSAIPDGHAAPLERLRWDDSAGAADEIGPFGAFPSVPFLSPLCARAHTPAHRTSARPSRPRHAERRPGLRKRFVVAMRCIPREAGWTCTLMDPSAPADSARRNQQAQALPDGMHTPNAHAQRARGHVSFVHAAHTMRVADTMQRTTSVLTPLP
jgi:hypothetical protein